MRHDVAAGAAKRRKQKNPSDAWSNRRGSLQEGSDLAGQTLGIYHVRQQQATGVPAVLGYFEQSRDEVGDDVQIAAACIAGIRPQDRRGSLRGHRGKIGRRPVFRDDVAVVHQQGRRRVDWDCHRHANASQLMSEPIVTTASTT
jgi:hypothetical protein